MSAASVVILTTVALLLVGWAAWERGPGGPKMIALTATLGAATAAGRVLFVAVPSVKPVTTMCLVAGAALGARAGMAVGALAALISNAFLGQGPWTPAQMLLWGAVAFGNVAGLQVYVVQQAEIHAPRAIDVASGLNIAAFNLGIAGGALLGGEIVARWGVLNTPWIGALVVLGALGLTAWSGVLDQRSALRPSRGGPAPVGH